jgi:AcrR family transcriptional regulator
MARRNKHSLEEIKAMILDAAETIITEQGYSALTVRKIAMKIGYTVGSIYMIFDNMADLADHIKIKTIGSLSGQLQHLPSNSPEQAIAALSRTYLKFACENFNCWRMVFAGEAECPEWYRQKMDIIHNLIAAQFAQLAPDKSAQQHQQATRALWSGVHGICMLSLSEDLDAATIDAAEKDVILLVECFIGGWLINNTAKKIN